MEKLPIPKQLEPVKNVNILSRSQEHIKNDTSNQKKELSDQNTDNIASFYPQNIQKQWL